MLNSMATLTNIARNIASIANGIRNSASIMNSARSGGTLATAGLYYGFGAFTYAGGEVLVSGSTTSITNQARS